MTDLVEYYTCLQYIKYIENRLLSNNYYSICPHYKVYDGNEIKLIVLVVMIMIMMMLPARRAFTARS